MGRLALDASAAGAVADATAPARGVGGNAESERTACSSIMAVADGAAMIAEWRLGGEGIDEARLAAP